MNTSDTYFDQIAAYATGGLSADERRALEAHLASCPTCAEELRSIRSLEQTMNAALAGAVPAADFEDRLVHRLRQSPAKRPWVPRGFRIHPAVRNAALATAAMLVLGGAGYVGSAWIETGKLPNLLADARSLRAEGNLRGVGQAAPSAGDESGIASNPFPSSSAVGGGFKSNRSLGWEVKEATTDSETVAAPGITTRGLNPAGSSQSTIYYGDGHTSLPQNNQGTRTNLNYSYQNRYSPADADGDGVADSGLEKKLKGVELHGTNTYSGGTTPNYGIADVGSDKAVNGRLGLPVDRAEERQKGTSHFFFDGKQSAAIAFKPGEYGEAAGKNALSSVGTVANSGTVLLGGKVLSGATDGTVANPQARPQLALQIPDVVKDGPFPPGDANAPAPAVPAPAVPPPVEQVKPAAMQQKIIRNGDVEFEVDSFDKTFATVTSIVIEEGGYVGSTNSDKLPNGKVKGTVVVRVPADRLDTLVLKLRALGDLKSQRITAQDITREYTDLQSELRAGRAMEERLLAIIKDGKGEIKDLLAAEKELANWRGKIEKVQGQVNYYNNLVALSTLNLTIAERNIETAAMATEREEVNVGIEAEDVDAARARALKEIADAKGRIVTSELKQMDAGQLAAKIVVDVAPDASGPLLDVLKQLGKVGRFDMNRQLTTPDNQPPKAPTRVDRKDTRLVLSLYNVVTVQPRTMTNLDLAVEDVEAAYKTIVDGVAKAGGRVVSNNLSRQSPTNVSGQVWFETKAADADRVLNELKALGASIRLTVTESQDTANTTTTKRGVVVALVPMMNVPARQSTSMAVEVGDVEGALAKVQSTALSTGARLSDGNLSRNTAGGTSARVVIDLPLAKADALRREIEGVGKLRAIQTASNSQAPEGPAARARIELTLATGDTIVAGEGGLWNSIRSGLSTSVAGLLWSLRLIVIGVCFVGPWVLLMWVFWKLLRRSPPSEPRISDGR